VIPDLIDQAVSADSIRLRTDGLEERSFLHANDFARGVVAVFEHYDKPSSTWDH
jgi:dTDP-D-glucose 4,6-dehydratase